RLVVACGIAGYIALVLWGLVLAPPTANSFKRVRALETMAKVQLGDADAAIWLDKLHPALANRSPRAAAAADIAGFESAIALLHGPTALAAQGSPRQTEPVASARTSRGDRGARQGGRSRRPARRLDHSMLTLSDSRSILLSATANRGFRRPIWRAGYVKSERPMPMHAGEIERLIK